MSQRRIVRELLAELLRARCGVRVVMRCASLDDCATRPGTAQLLVCDMDGIAERTLDAFMARETGDSPRLRDLRLYDESGSCDEIVNAVRGMFGSPRTEHEKLTIQENSVLLAVAGGLRNSDIARRLRRSPKTVEKHRANLQRKLGLRNVAQLTAYAIRHGLVNPDTILASRRG